MRGVESDARAAAAVRRFHVCQTGAGSQGTRDFLMKNYQALKTQNPALPILVRESSGVQAKLWARFGKGVEKSAALEGLDAAAVGKSLASLVK